MTAVSYIGFAKDTGAALALDVLRADRTTTNALMMATNRTATATTATMATVFSSAGSSSPPVREASDSFFELGSVGRFLFVGRFRVGLTPPVVARSEIVAVGPGVGIDALVALSVDDDELELVPVVVVVVVLAVVVVVVVVSVIVVVVVDVVGQSPSPPMQSGTPLCIGHALPVGEGCRVMVIVLCCPVSHDVEQALKM